MAATNQGRGWLDWSGGKRPVKPLQLIDIEFRDGVTAQRGEASGYDWQHDGSKFDVVRYRKAR